MPTRMLRDWTDSLRVNALKPDEERFFVRLMMKADDFGRFHAQPRLLRSLLFPLLIDSVRDADISRWIAACVKAGLIVVYESQGKQLLEIVNFGQRLRASRSKFPEPPTHGSSPPTIVSNSPPESEAHSESESESESEAHSEKSCSEPSEADAAEPELAPLMLFPIVGPEGKPKEWPLYADKVADYQETYPGIDAASEARKARQWCVDNKSRRKTAGGMPKFLNSWMAKAQDDSAKRPGAGISRPGNNGSRSPNLLERERQREDQQLEILRQFVEGDRQGDSL